MPLNPNSILVWAQVGQQLVQIASTEYGSFHAAMQANGIAADTAQLEKLRGLYDARITTREGEIAASGPVNGGQPGDSGD
jgi:hypothetical protein